MVPARTYQGSVEPRVAIVAEHASAAFGGEAILPLHYFRRLRARGVDAYLISHERTEEELRSILGADARRLIVVRDLPFYHRMWKVGYRLPGRVRALTTSLAAHLMTQVQQRAEVERLIRAGKINLVHQPSPVSPKSPSLLFGLGVPVIIGPMNGGMRHPKGFEHLEGPTQRAFVAAARAAAHVANLLLPGKRRADLLLVANRRTKEALPWGCRGRVAELVENGVDLSLFEPGAAATGARSAEDPFRLVYLGRLVDWKAVSLLLDAVARARRHRDVTLDVVGDGPERLSLEGCAGALGIRDAVRFHGFVPQSRCPELLSRGDALILPSLYECGGAVVLEAMVSGLPVIATDWGGPADYVTHETGILVAPEGREGFVRGLEDAILRLARDPELCERMGRAGRERAVADFDWERKVDRILEHYRWALGGPDLSAVAARSASREIQSR